MRRVVDSLRAIGKNEKLLLAIPAFLGAYGFLYLLRLAGVDKASFSGLGLPALIAIYVLLERTRENLLKLTDVKQRKRRIRYAAILSYTLSLTMIMGYQLQNGGSMDYGVKGKGLILLRALFLCFTFFPFGNMLIYGIEKIASADASVKEGRVWKNKAVFGVCAAVIFACLIPVWLAYYPIIMSYDFHRQINEAAKGFIWFFPYQPLIHTWIIWCFLQLGFLVGDLQIGMAGMALLQMLLYSLVTAWACVKLYEIAKVKWAVVAAMLYFGVFPLNSVMVVCTTKDVLFSILFLLFCLLLIERFFFCSGRKQYIIDALLVLEGCVMIQFRNNCLYAVAVFGVVWLIFAPKREKLRVLLLAVLLTAGGKGMSVGIKAALGTQIPEAEVEMYSVPIQQFARVGNRYGEALEPEISRLLSIYMPERLWDAYNPPISDTVKGGMGSAYQETWKGHEMELLHDWVTIGLSYPNEYIDAFLELTRGYWFLDDRSYAECLGWGVEGRMGIIYTYNSSEIEEIGPIEHVSKFPWLEEQLEKIVSGNAFYDWPVVSLLFKAAFYFWGLFVVFGGFLYLRKNQQALICAFPVLYMLTMLLGPVVQIRYLFPIMILLPVLTALLGLRSDAVSKVRIE